MGSSVGRGREFEWVAAGEEENFERVAALDEEGSLNGWQWVRKRVLNE